MNISKPSIKTISKNIFCSNIEEGVLKQSPMKKKCVSQLSAINEYFIERKEKEADDLIAALDTTDEFCRKADEYILRRIKASAAVRSALKQLGSKLLKSEHELDNARKLGSQGKRASSMESPATNILAFLKGELVFKKEHIDFHLKPNLDNWKGDKDSVSGADFTALWTGVKYYASIICGEAEKVQAMNKEISEMSDHAMTMLAELLTENGESKKEEKKFAKSFLKQLTLYFTGLTNLSAFKKSFEELKGTMFNKINDVDME